MDLELTSAVDRYVVPGRRYLKLLHGNVLFTPPPERAAFGEALARDAAEITDQALARLFDHEWRAQITAAWLVGFGRRPAFRTRVGELLLASGLAFAGQGFCFALARFGEARDAQVLVGYLDRYLARPDLRYDQPWALGALLHLDARLGADHAGRFLGEGGPWERWLAGSPSIPRDPAEHRRLVDAACAFAEEFTSAG